MVQPTGLPGDAQQSPRTHQLLLWATASVCRSQPAGSGSTESTQQLQPLVTASSFEPVLQSSTLSSFYSIHSPNVKLGHLFTCNRGENSHGLEGSALAVE